MDLAENVVDRWIERGGKFFRTLSRNPVIRAELLARGLTDDELKEGWNLYAKVNGVGAESLARATTVETSAAVAMNELDAWDAPAYKAAKAVLRNRYPEVEAFLFENLEASTGPAAVTGVERFLNRIDALRKGKAKGIEAKVGRAAVELLAKRKVLEEEREAKLRSLIETVRVGARPEEVVASLPADPKRSEAVQSFIAWLHEWREVARLALSRRAHLISLGLANRRQANDDSGDDDVGSDHGNDEGSEPAPPPRA